MLQLMLPIIPHGTTVISDLVSVVRDDDRWVYFVGLYPIYFHSSDDHKMFKLVTSQLIESGACRHSDIIKTFGVSKSSVNRALKKYRQGGIEAFFKKRTGGRCGTVLTAEKLEQAQKLLDAGLTRQNVSEQLEIGKDTVRKAISDGRLIVGQNEAFHVGQGSAKSLRSASDALAADGMGTACTRVMDRVFASLGEKDGADTRFEPCLDVPNAGVLCALPALLANGLLDGVEKFLGKIKGYYTILQILLLIAFMSLCRIKTVEKLRGRPPGEFGKLLGLDRIPEVKCLREKMDGISADKAAEKWAAHLSKKWMETNPETVGTYYIDGHVRVYNGKLTKLPRRFVSRQRLCLRATTDYWVNDAIGRPFFVVEKPVDPGLIKTLEMDIVPRLLDDVNQPSDSQLKGNPYLSRFFMVFDREGYSPAFLRTMWEKYRISCITYHKHPGDLWPQDWFEPHEVVMPSGETVVMRLAEMGSLVGSGTNAFWVREIRKLTESGHQTSIISTGYELCHRRLAACMFTRWCQENFFRYMKQHFDFDMLCEYGMEKLSDTERVVNPAWRQLNKSRNQLQNKIRYRQARFAELALHPESEDDIKKYDKWIRKKSEQLEEIQQYEREYENIKTELKKIRKHVTMNELDEKDRFYKLSSGRKRLIDTIYMIAYRSETAMISLLKAATLDSSEARGLLQDLFATEADILPEAENNILRVRVHNASRPAANRSYDKLFEKLNETNTRYPGTDTQIVYELVK
jgi:transposase